MLIATIKLHGRAEKRKEIVQTLKCLEEQLTKDGGCVKADLYLDLDDEDTFYLTGEWQTGKDLEKYKS